MVTFLIDALYAFFHVTCIGCKKIRISNDNDVICNQCVASITSVIPVVLAQKPSVTVYALAKYEGVLKALLNGKYYSQTHGYRWFSKKISKYIQQHGMSYDVIIPVSQHPVKRIFRYFNHASYMASIIGKECGILIYDYVCCTLLSNQASKTFEQRKLTKNSFIFYGDVDVLIGKRVLIIDDVMTTGSTLSSFLSVLPKKATYDIFVVART